MAAKGGKTLTTAASRRLRLRAERILDQEITFIFSRTFASLSDDDVELRPREEMYRYDSGSPLAAQDDAIGDLLTAVGEQSLFRRMNFLRYKASRLRSRLSRTNPKKKAVDEIERLQQEAETCRSMIAQANLRLVAKIARKLSRNEDFEDFQSEGNFILLYSIDRFDIDRGFRFSTYATHAIQRHLYRQMHRKARRTSRESITAGEILAESVEAAPVAEEPDFDPALSKRVVELMNTLDPREAAILKARFGFGGDKGEPLRAVATRLGLSKERVRQLQKRAIERLQGMMEPRMADE
ncbi:RNA polymerase sigma factor RpoD [Caulifigura coniformis]|uniref:RNA polymerase sigma factor RpoD n=1 Tax=Caulifigura coniformis TaxID=2527983 RepID=A0A517SM23_9PLAN|nr:sigma-70 family RNA polymerase sigma factor [Caulifigura coniformis]QDT57179.1 RNA polymerase sigma factor RpoD [Caulifigura coniformis]